MRDVAVIGVGCTKFDELWDTALRQLIVDAGRKAIEDAGITGEEIDALYIGNMSAGRFVDQEHIASLISDYAGLAASFHTPATRVESACASGGVAFRQAVMAIASGLHDIVIAAGVEKMTDVLPSETTFTLATAADQEWETFFGATFPSLYAMMARRHMHDFGTTREQLAMVAVKNHKNGCKNPNAQFQKEITIQDVLESPIVADPLRLLDCSPITDGAAVTVLCSADIAKRYTDTPVYVVGSGHATDTIALHDRISLTTLYAAVFAARRAYQMAKIEPKDINVAEVHDCFTIAEILAIEDLGFVKKGEGGKATEEGLTAIGGKIPVNPSGGLKAAGHPVGATGIKQIVEIVYQLREEANGRQVKGAEIGLAHNVGGSGGSAVIHILKR
ncbi:MAG: thiolase domain-containing protein [Euryarchaeota archaeon]|nr:thiolase domain-containing protein [Euryarchaeota archaeon]